MSVSFIRVYRPTADGRRCMFVYINNPRLKYEPLSLVAFCVYHPGTGEYHSYKFTESYNFDLNRELSSFVNCSYSHEHFSNLARKSRESFLRLLVSLGYDSDYSLDDFGRLF